MAEQEPPEGPLPDSAALGPDERQLLETGKAQHRETTATAKRALQVRAAGCAPVANSTLDVILPSLPPRPCPERLGTPSTCFS